MKYLGACSVVVLLVLTACGSFVRGEKNGNLPLNGEVPGLVLLDPKPTNYFSSQQKNKYLGDKAPLFSQYGLNSLYVGRYTYNGPDNHLTIESYAVDSSIGAAGIYYYYKGRTLYGGGQDIKVGAQGVIDTERDKRNLYFYKGRFFYAIVYSGKKPVPDLTPIAKEIAAITGGVDFKPKGFEYLDVPGVSAKFARVTWGNALNADFLPPSVTSLAYGAGKKCKVYVSSIGRTSMDGAERDFKRYLQMESPDDYKQSRITVGKGYYPFYQGKDESLGIVIFVVYEGDIITLTNVIDVAAGEQILRSIIEKARSLRYANLPK